ncbi:hypothetical protein DRQ09_09270, partial [candidate division KSB1 bacterium]
MKAKTAIIRMKFAESFNILLGFSQSNLGDIALNKIPIVDEQKTTNTDTIIELKKMNTLLLKTKNATLD